MKDIIVIGGGGFAKETLWLANDCNRRVRGVLDDNTDMHGEVLQGATVLGSVDSWTDYTDCEFVVAIGNPRIRQKVVNAMLSIGKPSFATLVHPTVRYSNTVSFKQGCIICAGCIFTADVKIGEHNIINLNVTVGHECEFSPFVTVAPMVAVSGNVTAHELVEVGTGAAIRQGVTLERGSMLGMGGVLTKSMQENAVFIGNPAKKFKEIK